MTSLWRHAAVTALCVCTATAAAITQDPPKPMPRPILILSGTLIDGTGGEPRHNDAIVIQEGRITAMGLQAARRAPKDARTIDASGKWILPGLIDANARLFASGGAGQNDTVGTRPDEAIRRAPSASLRSYVCAGITATVNLGGPSWVFDWQTSRADDPLAPHVVNAGPWLVAPVVPSIASPAAPTVAAPPDPDGLATWAVPDAAAAAGSIERLAKRGATLVAISGNRRAETASDAHGAWLAGVVSAAHARKLRAAVTVGSLDDVRHAVLAGADVVVGGLSGTPDDELVQRLVRQRIVYVPTLAALEATVRLASGGPTTVDPFEQACAPAAALQAFAQKPTAPGVVRAATPVPDNVKGRLADALASTKRLFDAGVTIAAGSAAGAPGLLPGTTLHRELALLVAAGLTPAQAIEAATRASARVAGPGQKLGVIKVGGVADLVLLDADPLADIRNLRRIVQVIKDGGIYER